MKNLIPGSAENLSYLFDKAIKKGQEEILCWYYYSLEFENKVKSLIADDRIKDKIARSMIYKEMKPFLPRICIVGKVKEHKDTFRRTRLLIHQHDAYRTSCLKETVEVYQCLLDSFQ